MKYLRSVILADFNNYPSYFNIGTMEGCYLNGILARPVALFGQSLEAIESQINFWKPHFIFCHMIFNRWPAGGNEHTHPNYREKVFDMLRRVRKNSAKVCYHAGDARIEPRYCDDISSFIDLGLVNHGLLDKFSKIWKVPCIHWPYACLNQLHHEIDQDPKFICDLVFAGTFDANEHHQPRTRFINELKKHINIKIFPNHEIGNTRFQTPELSSSAFGVLGVQMGLDIPFYTDVRPYQFVGSVALYFHDKCPSMDKIFVDGEHYVSYRTGSIESFMEKYNWCKDHPKEIAMIKRKGFIYCQEYHSTRARVRQVLDCFEGKEAKPRYI